MVSVEEQEEFTLAGSWESSKHVSRLKDGFGS